MLGNEVVGWLLGLSAAGILGAVRGVGSAVRNRQGGRQPHNTGTLSDWGERLGRVYRLRLEISRLRQEIERLQEDRRDLLRVLARVGDLLEREARRPGHGHQDDLGLPSIPPSLPRSFLSRRRAAARSQTSKRACDKRTTASADYPMGWSSPGFRIILSTSAICCSSSAICSRAYSSSHTLLSTTSASRL